MKSIKNTINLMVNSDIVSAFVMAYCFFAVYCPPFAKNIIQSSVLQMIRICGFGLIIILYLVKIIVQKRISIFVLSTSVFALYLLVMSIIYNSTSPTIYFYQVVNLMCAVLINDIFSSKSKKHLFYLVILFVLSFYLFSEIVFFVYNSIIKNETYSYIVYSNRNVMFVYLIPMFILYNYYLNSKYRIFYCFVIATSILFNIISNALTTSFVLIIYLFYVIYINKTHHFYSFQTSFSILVTIILLIFFVFIFFGTHSFYVGFIRYLFTFTKRVQSLIYREELYDLVRQYVLRHPIFGFGYRYYYDYNEVMSRHFFLTHNTIFDIIMWGGFVALTLFFINQWVVIANSRNDKRFQAYVVFAIFIIALRDMLESTSLYFIFFNYALLYYFIGNCDYIQFDRFKGLFFFNGV